jgi:hypothetical protein
LGLTQRGEAVKAFAEGRNTEIAFCAGVVLESDVDVVGQVWLEVRITKTG